MKKFIKFLTICMLIFSIHNVSYASSVDYEFTGGPRDGESGTFTVYWWTMDTYDFGSQNVRSYDWGAMAEISVTNFRGSCSVHAARLENEGSWTKRIGTGTMKGFGTGANASSYYVIDIMASGDNITCNGGSEIESSTSIDIEAGYHEWKNGVYQGYGAVTLTLY